MAFDMRLGQAVEAIPTHEEFVFQLIHDERFPKLNWLWEQFYIDPQISPKQADALLHEVLNLWEQQGGSGNKPLSLLGYRLVRFLHARCARAAPSSASATELKRQLSRSEIGRSARWWERPRTMTKTRSRPADPGLAWARMATCLQRSLARRRSSRASNHMPFRMATVEARPTPRIQAKYHMIDLLAIQ